MAANLIAYSKQWSVRWLWMAVYLHCGNLSILLLPVCVRLCLSSWLRFANAFTQEEQLKTRGFWELGDGPGWCTRSCSCGRVQKHRLNHWLSRTKSFYYNMSGIKMKVMIWVIRRTLEPQIRSILKIHELSFQETLIWHLCPMFFFLVSKVVHATEGIADVIVESKKKRIIIIVM